MSNSTAFARYYRPQSFDQLYGHKSVVQTLKGAIKQGRLAQAYLFAGGHGTGKTSLARILAKILNCDNPSQDYEPCNQCNSCREITQSCSIDVLEIDGASNRGIEDIRKIKDTIGYAAPRGRYKIYIIDEVHMLTKEAFNALLKTLEEPPEKAKFFFATTEPHKIPATILSRCQRFDLSRLSKDEIESKLKSILRDRSLDFEDDAIKKISLLANGSMRDAESLLDQVVSLSQNKVVLSEVEAILSLPPTQIFYKFDQAFAKGDFSAVYDITNHIFSNGLDVRVFIEQLIAHIQSHFKSLLGIAINIPSQEGGPIYTKDICLTALDWLVDAYDKFRYYPVQNLFLECLLIKIVRLRFRVPLNKAEVSLGQNHVDTTSIKSREPAQSEKNAIIKPENLQVELNNQKEKSLRSIKHEGAFQSEKEYSTPTSSPNVEEKSPSININDNNSLPEQTSFLESASPKPSPSVSQHSAQITKSEKTTIQKVAITKDDINRFDTIMQFAAVEFAGKLEKKK